MYLKGIRQIRTVFVGCALVEVGACSDLLMDQDILLEGTKTASLLTYTYGTSTLLALHFVLSSLIINANP